jgi:hypothetical protein
VIEFVKEAHFVKGWGWEGISTCKAHFLASMRGLFEKREEKKLGFIKVEKVVRSTSMRGCWWVAKRQVR